MWLSISHWGLIYIPAGLNAWLTGQPFNPDDATYQRLNFGPELS